MTATDPVHQRIEYNNGEYKTFSYEDYTEDELDKLLKKASFPYSWGVYTTSLARKQLQDAIKLCGDRLIYCDTDSVKTVGPVNIERLNGPLMEKAVEMRAYADDMKGERHYIGLFEPDAHYDQFITQGAKRYAYMIDGKLGITVAGVTKKINEQTGVSFAVEELKSLDRFRVGMVWRNAGGTISVYNDTDNFDYTDPLTGKTIHIGPNVSIVPTTYEMTHEKDYKRLLEEIELYGDFRRSQE